MRFILKLLVLVALPGAFPLAAQVANPQAAQAANPPAARAANPQDANPPAARATNPQTARTANRQAQAANPQAAQATNPQALQTAPAAPTTRPAIGDSPARQQATPAPKVTPAPTAAPPAAPAAPLKAAPDAQAQQQAAMAAMQESLAKQRASVQKQTGQGENRGFFVLAGPSSMGAAAIDEGFDAPAEADCDPLPGPEVDSLVGDAATRAAVDPSLIRSVMRQESGFRPCAVSPKGAMGLMQLMPATAQQLGVRNAFDARQNVDAGARLLKQLMIRYAGDLPKVLAAYNAGPATVDATGGVPNIPETVDYIQRIMTLLPKI